MNKLRVAPKKLTNVFIASAVGCALLLSGTTYALWSASAPANTAAVITDGDLKVTAGTTSKWIDITKSAAPVTLDSLEGFLLVPGDKLQLTQDLNVIVVGDNITGKLKVLIPNTTASAALLAQTKMTLTLLDKNNAVIGTITPTVNTTNSLELEVTSLRQTVAAGETYKAQITVELPTTANNATKVQAGALQNIIVTLNQGAPYVAPYPTANPAAQFAYTSNTSGVTITNYTGSSKDVVIPQTITVAGVPKPVISIGEKAFWNKALTSVVMPDTVTYVGTQSFQSNKLTTIKISKAMKTIGFAAFNANLLTEVSIPDSVTTIESAAFGQNKIATLKLSKNLTSIGGTAFADNLITSVVLPSGVKTLESQVFYNNRFASVTIPSGVTSIAGGAFTSNVAVMNVYFEGNAPATVDASAFGASAKALVYRHTNATGFTNPWKGYQTAIY